MLFHPHYAKYSEHYFFYFFSKVDEFEEDIPHSSSLQFNNAESDIQNNTPIVLNNSTLFASNRSNDAVAGLSGSTEPIPNAGIASPDSVVNYNFDT